MIGVLIRFREELVAVVADIESMLHQVKVDPQDSNALRFLWWPNGDLGIPPQEYQMVVHVFGMTTSARCSHVCLKRTAEDNQDRLTAEVVQTVKGNVYVDDCLKSVRTSDNAKTLVNMLSKLLSLGGFHFTKWVSNDREVLASIPQSERAKSIFNLDLDDRTVEREN